jgi:hypothetical protein
MVGGSAGSCGLSCATLNRMVNRWIRTTTPRAFCNRQEAQHGRSEERFGMTLRWLMQASTPTRQFRMRRKERLCPSSSAGLPQGATVLYADVLDARVGKSLVVGRNPEA